MTLVSLSLSDSPAVEPVRPAWGALLCAAPLAIFLALAFRNTYRAIGLVSAVYPPSPWSPGRLPVAIAAVAVYLLTVFAWSGAALFVGNLLADKPGRWRDYWLSLAEAHAPMVIWSLYGAWLFAHASVVPGLAEVRSLQASLAAAEAVASVGLVLMAIERCHSRAGVNYVVAGFAVGSPYAAVRIISVVASLGLN